MPGDALMDMLRENLKETRAVNSKVDTLLANHAGLERRVETLEQAVISNQREITNLRMETAAMKARGVVQAGAAAASGGGLGYLAQSIFGG